MKKRIYELTIAETDSLQIEQKQRLFMSTVMDLAQRSGLIGHGLEITLTNHD